MKKVFLLTICMLTVLLISGCSYSSKNESLNVTDSITTLDIFGAKIKFKKSDPTNFWDTQDNFGAAEIDTVYFFSKDGVEVENYENIDTAIILFQTNQLTPTNKNDVKTKLNRWHQITNPTITELDNRPFMYHIIGESSSTYYESYYTEYIGKFDNDESKVYYEIILKIPKNKLTDDEQKLAKDEYHIMMSTLKFE